MKEYMRNFFKGFMEPFGGIDAETLGTIACIVTLSFIISGIFVWIAFIY